MSKNYDPLSGYHIISKVCSICRKEFVPSVDHMYKQTKAPNGNSKITMQCSYTCYRKAGGDSERRKDKKTQLTIRKELSGIIE